MVDSQQHTSSIGEACLHPVSPLGEAALDQRDTLYELLRHHMTEKSLSSTLKPKQPHTYFYSMPSLLSQD